MMTTAQEHHEDRLATPIERTPAMTLPESRVLGRLLTFCSVAAAIAATLLASHDAHAITPTGDRAGPAPRSVKPTGFAPQTSTAVVPLELIAGTITAIDRLKKTVTIGGNVLTWHNAKLRVFGGNGVAMTDRELATGMRVRFAFEPGSKESRTIVLVYVDAQS